MEKHIKIKTKDDNKLALFLTTLYAVAKDMDIKVETIRVTK